jgi:hypothetical protein
MHKYKKTVIRSYIILLLSSMFYRPYTIKPSVVYYYKCTHNIEIIRPVK